MASDGSDQDAKYALSKLLQRGTMAEYEREAFFRARITEARFENENNQAVDTNIGDADVKDKQEVKKMMIKRSKTLKMKKARLLKINKFLRWMMIPTMMILVVHCHLIKGLIRQ
uniref:Uncharacterized protein n=1 Tax=Tanacetum cinerariifolium TaxID=118510 RepID=A0A6L2P3L6_TANCI|nr:hypothetical protein [Tanacetum cinerariifolium]